MSSLRFMIRGRHPGQRKWGSVWLLASGIAALLGPAGASAQQVYSLSGKFASNRGVGVQIPLVGGVACSEIRHGISHGTTTPAPTTMTLFMTFPAAPHGCVPGGPATVTTTGAGLGGEFTLPPHFFSLPPRGSTIAVSVPAPAVVQLATSLGVYGPALTPTAPPRGTMWNGTNSAVPRRFRASAWSTQTGRVAPTFTWCPGNPNCTAVTQVSSYAPPMIVKYHGGPNRFGGTMGILIHAGQNPSSRAITAGGPVGIFELSTGSQPTGRGYADLLTDVLVGPVWSMYEVAPVYVPQRMETHVLITSLATFLGSAGISEHRYGFPFTTGTVVARRTGLTGGQPFVSTLTAMGGDSVTPQGARNLSLVAGGLAFTDLGTYGVSLSQMSLALPEPRGEAALAAGALVLLAIAAWRARVSRRADLGQSGRTP